MSKTTITAIVVALFSNFCFVADFFNGLLIWSFNSV